MSFNGNTYRANKWRRDAWDQLAQARAIKERVLAGVAYDWEKPRIAVLVKLARNSMRISLNYRDMKRMGFR